MKLLCLDPVTYRSTEEELAYMGRFLNSDTELLCGGIQDGPRTIQSEYDEALAQPEVIRMCVEAEREGVDGIFINCFGDPGVRAAREATGIPIFGGFEPVMLTAMGMADRIAIVTVLDNVIPMISANVLRAGISDRVTCIRSVSIPVEALTDRERLTEALVCQSMQAVRENGAQIIVLGCTAMVEVAEAVQAGLLQNGYDIPVLEAAQTALKLLEMYAAMGISHSRRTYMSVADSLL